LRERGRLCWPAEEERTFLSSQFKNLAQRDKSWAKYEMDSLEPEISSSHMGGKEVADFVPLENTTDQHKRRREIEDIRREAQENASALEREAYEKGFAQGEKDGVELGQRKALKLIENIENLLTSMDDLKQEILALYEREIVELVFAIAEKVIHRTIRSDDVAIKGTVLSALKLAAEKSKATLRVNPEDFDYVEELRPEFFAAVKELKALTVTSDPSITRGGCLLESPYGDVDARIETQLEKIHQCLEQVFAERKDD
jgi:flagellar assembly protein FliH